MCNLLGYFERRHFIRKKLFATFWQNFLGKLEQFSSTASTGHKTRTQERQPDRPAIRDHRCRKRKRRHRPEVPQTRSDRR